MGLRCVGRRIIKISEKEMYLLFRVCMDCEDEKHKHVTGMQTNPAGVWEQQREKLNFCTSMTVYSATFHWIILTEVTGIQML